MKKELLSIVKFFLSAFFTSSISFPLYGEAGVVKNLADSGKTAYSGFASAPFKKIGSGNKYSSAIFGNALNFDGENDYVTIGAGLTLPQTGWTEEMWIYVPTVSADILFMGLISGDNVPVLSKRGAFLTIQHNTTLHGGYGYGTENNQRSYEARNVLTVNAWNHIAQTYNGSRLKAYVNGVQVADVAAPERPNNIIVRYLGRGLARYYYDFKGAMDEVRIWSRARTAEEIRDNYANTVPSNHPDLLLYYSFDQGTAGGDNRRISAVTDNTGRNNGVFHGFALNGPSSNYVSSLVLLDAPVVEAASSVTDDSFTVRWRAPSGRITNYILEIATSADFTKKASGHHAYITVPATQTTFTVSGLSPDVTYYCRVRAAVAGIVGIASNIIPVKTTALSGLGNALSFDGERQGDGNYVTMGAGLTLPHTGWTEEMWIYVPTLSADASEEEMMVIGGSEEPELWSKRGPFLMIKNNTSLWGGYGYGTGDNQINFYARNVLTVNAWNHIAQTYNGSRLKAYVNGVQVADVEAMERPNANLVKYLGRGLAGYFYDFKGTMDEVRIWSRARTAEEIRDNYTKTVSSNHPDLLLYYSFNQGMAGGDNSSISAVTDNTGRNNGVFHDFDLNGTSSNYVSSLVLLDAPVVESTSSVTEGSFTVRWQALSGRVTNYILEIATSADFTKKVPGYEAITVPATQTSFTVSGLSPDVTYYYRVRAAPSGAFFGAASNIISVKTTALSGFGNALRFDGERQGDGNYVTMGAGLTLPHTGWTEEMWIYVPTVSADVSKEGMVVIGNDMTNWSIRAPFLLVFGNTLGGGYGIEDNQIIFEAPNVLTVNAWNHIAQTYNGSRLKAYVNGVQVADVEASEQPNNNMIKYLGRGLAAEQYYDFIGSMDEVRIWNYARSEEEIRYNYTKTVDPNDPDLLAYYDFNQGIAGGDNRAIKTLIDNKGSYAILNNFAKTGAESNFVGTLKLVPPTATPASEVTFNSFTARWAWGKGSYPAANTYFIDVSTDETFADASKYVTGYRNKELGNVAELTITGLNPSTAYYYRVRAGYSAPWLHRSDNSNTITVNTGVLSAITAVDATNITEGSFTAGWKAPSSGRVTNYILEIATSADFTKKVPRYETITVPSAQTSFTVSGLTPDVTYYYRVKAVAGGATGTAGNIIPVKTAALSGFGNALNFDGADDYVIMGEELTLPQTGWTEEMWIYVPTLSADVSRKGIMVIGGDEDEMNILSKRAPFLLIQNNTALFGGYGTRDNQIIFDAPNVLTVNAWNHIAQTYNGSRLKAYVNGVQVADVEAMERPNANPIKYLGRGHDWFCYDFKGMMDEVRIWSRARTAEEIRDNYAKTVPSNHPDLLLYYSFNQGTAGEDNRSISAVTDNMGRNNGVFHGFALKGPSSNYVSSLVLLDALVVEATNITEGSFTAGWKAPSGIRVNNYILEIAASADFTKKVPGYETITVPATQTSFTVSGLSPDVTYYCRVRVAPSGTFFGAANIIPVKTAALSGLGNALSFDGADDFVALGTGFTLPQTGWTEEMWVYVPTVSADVSKNGMIVISNDEMNNFSKRAPFLMIYDDTSLYGGYGYGTGNTQKTYDARNVLTVNAWNHVAQTYNGSRLKAYVNGVQVADVVALERPNANPIKYLGRAVVEYHYYFKGAMDEVRIWNYARSAEEIRDNYKTTVSPSSTGLIAYYDFNQGIAGGDNRAIKTLIDNKGSYAILNNFAKTGAESNFVGTLKLVPPTATPASEVTFNSFTARWAGGEGSSPTANTYFIDVSTDETFADESKYVTGYRNKEVGNVAELTLTGLNPSTAYYYRVRAGYSASWLHPNVNSNTITVNTGALPAITAVDATNIAEGSFTIGWQAPSSGRVTNYILEIATSADFTKKIPGYETITVPATQTSFTVSGLTPDVTYYCRVKAVSGGATGTAGNIIPVKTAGLGSLGNALSFDGEGEGEIERDGNYVTMGAGLTLPQTGWTEEMWIYVPTVSDYVNYMGLIGGDELTLWSKRGPFLMIKNNTTLHGGYGTGDDQTTYEALNVLTINAWNHIAQTYDGSRLKAYVNGIQVVDVEALELPNDNPIKYLGRGLAGYYYDFKGAMDEVRIWSRARTAEEIGDNYAKTVPSNHPDLLLYYSFNQGMAGGDNRSISAVTDNTGKNHGSFSAFALNGASSNFISSLVLLGGPRANPAADITEGSFTASWEKLLDPRITGYVLEVARDAKFTNLVLGYDGRSFPASVSQLEVKGLSPAFKYYYRVKTVTEGVGIAGNIIPVKTRAITGLGNALSFSGDEEVNFSSNNGIWVPYNQWTQEMWVYISDIESGEYQIFGGSHDSRTRGPCACLSIIDKTRIGSFNYDFEGNMTHHYTNRGVFTVGGWNHIARTYDGEDLKVYVNGVLSANFNLPGTPYARKIIWLALGNESPFFKGYVDEFRIWNYPRSAEEIRDNYKTPVSPSSAGLIAYYDFNQGIAGGDNRVIETLIDNKGSFVTFPDFDKTGSISNFVGDLKLVPPTATPASEVIFSSFTARWALGEGSTPTANTYFLDVSTDETFTDDRKFVPGYHDKEIKGDATEHTVNGLNTANEVYYYRLRAGYAAPWLHPSVYSNVITVNGGALPAVRAVEASNITEDSFTASWQPPSGRLADGYILKVARDESFTSLAPGYENLLVAGNQTQFEVKGLSPNFTWYYQVKAVYGEFVGIASNIVSVKTMALSGLGNALGLYTTDDYVDLGKISFPANEWTQELWFYLPKKVSAEVKVMDLINSKEMKEPAQQPPFLQIVNPRDLRGGYGDELGLKTYYVRNAITLDAWNHLAQTFDGRRLKAYLNGILVADLSAPGNSTSGSSNFYLSNYPDNLKNLKIPPSSSVEIIDKTAFKGRIDELRIWNYARSAEEIKNNYKTPVSTTSEGLIVYYDFNQGVAGGDNRAIEALIDHKGVSRATLNKFTKTGVESNFVGTLKLVPPAAAPAIDVTGNSFTACWAMSKDSSPTVNTYFIDVSTDKTFADESKYVAGYRNKEVGNVTKITVNDLNRLTAYYYRVRAGYSAPWLHQSVSSAVIQVNLVPAVKALEAVNITAGSFTAKWEELKNPQANSYILEVAKDANFIKLVPGNESFLIPAGATSWEVSGLSPAYTYYYRVKAVVGEATGTAGNIIPVKTAALSGLGNALNFSGKERLTISNGGISFPANEWTQEMWIYIEKPKIQDYDNSSYSSLITSETVSNRGPSMYIYNKTKLHGGYNDGGAWKNYTTSKDVLTVDAWNHVAQTFDGADLKVYVNGVLVKSFYLPGTSNAYKINYIRYGEEKESLISIDEVRIWKKARTAAEIKNNYTKTVSPNHADLLAYYDFNQGIAGGDNRDIETIIDNKNAYNATFNKLRETGFKLNFRGSLKLVPPAAAPASDITGNSFTARWAMDKRSSPTPNTYFIDVSTDETFTDESKFVAGYRNKELGKVTEHIVKGLNMANGVYYYRLRAGYSAPWLHQSVNSNVIGVNDDVFPAVRAVEATNITEGSFTASWQPPLGKIADGYILKVARDASFTSLVPGYENLRVPKTQTQVEVKGLSPDFTWYYQVKAVFGEVVGIASNVVSVKTAALSGLGNALAFDGENDCVAMGAGLTLPQTGWTEEMWIYVPTLSAAALKEEMMIIGGGDEMSIYSKRAPFLMIYDNTSLGGGYGYGTGNNLTYTAPNVLTVNAWNHIAQTYNGSRLKAYVNGVQVADVEAMERPNANPIKYLGRGLAGFYYDFIGSMDEVRIWSRARTAEEIRDNYANTVPSNHPDLLAYYDFNQGVTGGDNRAIKVLIDHKGAYSGELKNFDKISPQSNFVGNLKLVPPAALTISITGNSFTARWAMGVGSSPTANKYFIDVSTDETFADESKYVPGYRNKELGDVTSHTVTGLNTLSEVYYYRLRAGYAAPWLHQSVNSAVITANSALPVVTALKATDITEGSFMARWEKLDDSQVISYVLEVAKDAGFTNLVFGYENFSLPAWATSWKVTGLNPAYTYYYRVKTDEGVFDNIIPVKTLELSGLGNALNFSGKEKVVFSNGGISFPNQWTQEMWVYISSGFNSENLYPSSYEALLANENEDFGSLSLYIKDKTKLYGGYGNNEQWTSYTTSKVLQPEAWNHIAQTFDGHRLQIYVNGVFAESFILPEISNKYKINYIGYTGKVKDPKYFQGNIDEVRIWNRARTAEEIRDNYTKTVSPKDADLIAYYDFNQGIAGGDNRAIEALIDNKGGYNGQLEDFAKTETRSNFVGELKLSPPVASSAIDITEDSFTARWAMGEGSTPTANTYFIDVSTDETFADESKYVAGYRNKELGNVTSHTVKGLNMSSGVYYYRLRAGYGGSWLHSSVSSGVVSVSSPLQSNTILLASMDEKVYGSSPYQLSVSSSGTGSYAYTLISGDAVSISSTGLVSVLKAGTATISVTQSSDGVYASGGPVIQVITVHPKQLTIAVHAIDKEYDGSTKAFVNLSVIGRIDHDDVTVIARGAAFDNKNVGRDKPVYIKSVVLSGSESANYALSAIPSVSASITPRTLIVQAENKTRSIGDDNPLLTVVYKGFIEGDNENNALLSPPLITTKADKSSPSGDYPIEANGAVSLHDNYQIIYHSGVLTVTPVSVTSFTFKASLLYSDSPVGSFAGSFSTESALPSTYAYTLVSGAVDNDKFVLEGENLYVNSKFNYKSDVVFTIRVLVSTQWGFSVIKDFPVNVLHKNKAPTLDRIPDQSVCATSASHSINLSGLSSGGETEQSLSLSISSDRVEMFHTLNVSFLSDGQGVINYSLNSGVSGSAFVTVTVTDNGGTANGGVDAYAVSFRVTSNPLPSIIISSNTDKFKVIRGGSLELTASSPGSISYLWAETKGVLGSRNGSRLLVQPLENTVYMVEVTTEGGCVEFKQIVVEVEDESMDEVVVNNILTPNGDGVNDLWVVQHIERYPNAVVKVFDRGRRLVFIQKGYDNKWDGSFKGRPLRGGTYYYAIDFEGAKKETKKGYLSIIY